MAKKNSEVRIRCSDPRSCDRVAILLGQNHVKTHGLVGLYSSYIVMSSKTFKYQWGDYR